MDTVLKYPIYFSPNSNITEVELPRNAQVLRIDMQAYNEGFFIWARVNSEDKDIVTRKFCISGTGHELVKLPEDQIYRHITTFLADNGRLVLHAFEVVTISYPDIN